MVAVCTLLMYQNSKPSLPACQPQSYHVCSFMMCCCPCRFMPVVHETDWHIEGYSCLITFFFKSHFPLGWKAHASNIFLCQSTLSNLIFPCCPCVVRPWILLASVFAPAFLQLLPTTPHSTIPPFCLQKLVAWKPVVSHRLHVPSAHWMWKGTAAVATEPSPPTWDILVASDAKALGVDGCLPRSLHCGWSFGFHVCDWSKPASSVALEPPHLFALRSWRLVSPRYCGAQVPSHAGLHSLRTQGQRSCGFTVNRAHGQPANRHGQQGNRATGQPWGGVTGPCHGQARSRSGCPASATLQFDGKKHGFPVKIFP